MAAIAVLGVTYWFVRRWALSKPAESSGQIWSLQQLRDLQARGEITPGEFDRLKAIMLEDFRRADESAEDADESAS